MDNKQLKEVFEGLKEQAIMMANYRGQLVEAGFTEAEAMKIIIAYQAAIINAGAMANIERQKNEQLAFAISKHPFTS